MGILSEFKILFVFIATLIIIWKSGCVQAQAFSRDGRRRVQDYNDGALMAHTIGSAGLNTEYYFNTLGIACENQASSLYRVFERYERNCTAEVSLKIRRAIRGRSNQPKEYSGSLDGFCDKWEDNRKCKLDHAKDLDVCLGEPKGSEAFGFMDAFASYTCRSTREANSHITDRPTKSYRYEPGVFKCFEATQDRILNCVKNHEPPMPFCRWFKIVEECFSEFFTRRTCEHPSTVAYIEGLFKSMSADLRCPLSSDSTRHDPDSGWGWKPTTTTNPPFKVGWGEVRYSPPPPPPPTSGWGTHTKLNHYDYYDTVWKQPHLRPSWDDPVKTEYDPFGPLPTKIPDYNDRYTTTRKTPRRRYRENEGSVNRFKLPTVNKGSAILDDQLIYLSVAEDETNEQFFSSGSKKSNRDDRDELSSTTPYYLKETSSESTGGYIALGHRVSGRSTTFGPYSTISTVSFQVQTPEEETTTQRKRRFRKVRRSTTTTSTTTGPLSITEVITSKDKLPPSGRIG